MTPEQVVKLGSSASVYVRHTYIDKLLTEILCIDYSTDALAKLDGSARYAGYLVAPRDAPMCKVHTVLITERRNEVLLPKRLIVDVLTPYGVIAGIAERWYKLGRVVHVCVNGGALQCTAHVSMAQPDTRRYSHVFRLDSVGDVSGDIEANVHTVTHIGLETI